MPGVECAGGFLCRQMKNKMQVAFMWDKLGSKEVAMEDIPDWRVRTLRNMTINTGCSCTRMMPIMHKEFPAGPKEK